VTRWGAGPGAKWMGGGSLATLGGGTGVLGSTTGTLGSEPGVIGGAGLAGLVAVGTCNDVSLMEFGGSGCARGIFEDLGVAQR
jgi:hypothetical protein